MHGRRYKGCAVSDTLINFEINTRLPSMQTRIAVLRCRRLRSWGGVVRVVFSASIRWLLVLNTTACVAYRAALPKVEAVGTHGRRRGRPDGDGALTFFATCLRHRPVHTRWSGHTLLHAGNQEMQVLQVKRITCVCLCAYF